MVILKCDIEKKVLASGNFPAFFLRFHSRLGYQHVGIKNLHGKKEEKKK